MNGPVCQTYGVTYSVTNKRGVKISSERVCDADQLISDSISFESIVKVELWYQKAFPNYDATCYFWCTENGEIPKPEEDAIFDFSLLQQLVSPTGCARDCGLGGQPA